MVWIAGKGFVSQELQPRTNSSRNMFYCQKQIIFEIKHIFNPAWLLNIKNVDIRAPAGTKMSFKGFSPSSCWQKGCWGFFCFLIQAVYTSCLQPDIKSCRVFCPMQRTLGSQVTACQRLKKEFLQFYMYLKIHLPQNPRIWALMSHFLLLKFSV